MTAFESVSTWRQPPPRPVSAARTALVREVAARVAGRGPGRLRVAVDGFTAAGKTSFGPELSLARGIARDTESEGGREAAARLHRDRYHAAEQLYLAEVDPYARADVVIDNRDFAAPRLR